MPRPTTAFTIGALLFAVSGCGGGIKQPYAQPAASRFVEHVRENGKRAMTYVATNNTMDYWLGDDRIKTLTHVMGERGARVRFNAIDPQTNDTAADLACNGRDFTFVDYPHDCYLTGICNREAIGQLLRVSLEPDDFLLLAIGSTPIIPDPSGSVKWDEDNGTWVVDLKSKDRRRQKLVLDGNDADGGKWEVLESTVWDANGKVEWDLDNKKFVTVTGVDGQAFRLPSGTKFVQPQQKADVVIDWGDRRINGPAQDPSKYEFPVPEGLRMCVRK